MTLASDRPPAGYPTDLERHHRLGDGRTLFVRPVVPDDAVLLARALEAADPETVYQRFLREPVRLDAMDLDRLTRLDYTTRLALAAFAPDGSGIGIVRYETVEPGIAEMAIVVDAAWRGQGVASMLLELLESAAAERGIKRMTAYFLPSNRAVIALLQAFGYATEAPDRGVATAAKDLAPST